MEAGGSSETEIFRASVRRLAERHLASGRVERANAEGYPWDVARLLGESGLFGITLGPADGGSGGTLMDAVAAIEEVAAVCPRSADVIQAGNFGAIRTFAEFATAEQKRRYLPDLIAGRALMSVAMSEPEAGSALTELQTRAEASSAGDIVLNGTKVYSTHSAEATVFLVYVRFGPGVKGIGAVLVDRDTPGLSFGRPVRYASGDVWCQLYFESCRIPAANLLLPAGGFGKLISGFNVERLGNTARSLAVARHAFELAREHALQRRQFGRLLCEFQGLQWKFADMATKLEAARLLLYAVVAKADRGLPPQHETAMAKLFCNTVGFEAAHESLQVLGASGFCETSLAEYCFRRVRGWMIAGGTVELMRTQVAEGVFGRRFPQKIQGAP